MIPERNLLKYLLSTVDNGYVKHVKIKSACKDKIRVTLQVESKERVNSVYGMIEANLHINKDLGAKKYVFSDEGATVHTYDNMTYYICVK